MTYYERLIKEWIDQKPFILQRTPLLKKELFRGMRTTQAFLLFQTENGLAYAMPGSITHHLGALGPQWLKSTDRHLAISEWADQRNLVYRGEVMIRTLNSEYVTRSQMPGDDWLPQDFPDVLYRQYQCEEWGNVMIPYEIID